MNLRVLGCWGSSMPNKFLTSFLVNKNILVDAGSPTKTLEFDEQLEVEHIFITHSHLDHVLGVLFLADNVVLNNIKKQFKVYGSKDTLNAIKKHLLNFDIWPDFTAIPKDFPTLRFEAIDEGETIKIDNLNITPIKLNHRVSCLGYLFENDEENIFFCTDTGPTDHTWKYLKDKKINRLIIEVSFPDRLTQLAIQTAHLTPTLLFDEIKKMNTLPDQILITHIKPHYKDEIFKELESLKQKLPSNIKITTLCK
ncbi:3',5'-cyclic-nucleotide phosphodiesterase [Hippea jasoniae]|uniref:3',5'-cyclic-nucleotide phosphodiesterase n=1 Tax=Hippea jasoniae TaxID=944479 RepID=UPI00068FE0E7|nr:3',5'-cyclic-nucleotide phosphodiesterase [Hippea jasoniae]